MIPASTSVDLPAPVPQIRLYSTWLKTGSAATLRPMRICTVGRWRTSRASGAASGIMTASIADAVRRRAHEARCRARAGSRARRSIMRGRCSGMSTRRRRPASPRSSRWTRRGDTVTLGWAELRRQAASLALELRARAIAPGDRVAGLSAQHPRGGRSGCSPAPALARSGRSARPTWGSTRCSTACARPSPRR